MLCTLRQNIEETYAHVEMEVVRIPCAEVFESKDKSTL